MLVFDLYAYAADEMRGHHNSLLSQGHPLPIDTALSLFVQPHPHASMTSMTSMTSNTWRLDKAFTFYLLPILSLFVSRGAFSASEIRQLMYGHGAVGPSSGAANHVMRVPRHALAGREGTPLRW